MLNDERIREAIIEVINYQGVVSLLGTVESHETAELAEEIASQQEGVIVVVNNLKEEAVNRRCNKIANLS